MVQGYVGVLLDTINDRKKWVTEANPTYRGYNPIYK